MAKSAASSGGSSSSSGSSGSSWAGATVPFMGGAVGMMLCGFFLLIIERWRREELAVSFE